MERQVILRDRQEQQAADHNNIQAFVSDTFDHLVFDAIEDGKAYGGLTVTQVAAASVKVNPGRLYTEGVLSVSLNERTMSVAERLPLIAKRISALVAWPTVTETDTQPRDFLINAETREVEPQQVAMERQRTASLGWYDGEEQPTPIRPTVPDTYVVVAYVTLTPAGIETIEQVTANRIQSVKDNSVRIGELEAFRAQAEPKITTLGSDIAALAGKLSGVLNTRDLSQVFIDVANIKNILELPDDYSAYSADHFLDDRGTDVGNLDLLAKVEEGIRFPDENAGVSEMAIFSALDPNASLVSGMLLPKYTNALRLSVGPRVDELSIAQYGYSTHEFVQKTMSRQRIRYGTSMTVCTNAAWWRSGHYDQVTGIFRRDGETWEVHPDDRHMTGINHKWIRVTQFFIDTYEEPYWDAIKIDHTIEGAQVAQTFLNTQDGWLTRLDLTFTRKEAAGLVHISICETEHGAPEKSRTLAHVQLSAANIRVDGTVTPIAIPPTFLKAGGRYAIVLTTNASHYVAMASGNSYTAGTFFYSTDGAFFQGDLTRDLMFRLHFARFNRPRVEIQLQPLQLSGGITDIDFLAAAVTTPAAQLHFEVQVGGVWRALGELSPNLLVGLPPLLPLRAVFLGTSDIMPGLTLTGSSVTVSRPRTTFRHISSARTLQAPSSEIKVILRLEYWNASRHTVDAQLIVGSNTHTADMMTEREVEAGTVERTYTFDLATATDTYKIDVSGNTTTALEVFHVARRTDLAF